MQHRSVHLICNSHIDPVWLWEWQEGAAAALATFRTAADLCEEFDGFVFNHNEAILYRWIEEYEPALFRRIQRLVREKKWHIMGGWHLQPDCNMPSGESFVRQALSGKLYFREKFGVEPRTAVNLDPFGHSRGLVQILAKAGYDSYLFCRPSLADAGLPAPEFMWAGFDGSEIAGTLAVAHYNSSLGQARRKVEDWVAAHPGAECSALLWGIGDHGGGPSRRDLADLAALMRAAPGAAVRHSTPDAYFRELRRRRPRLPRHAGGLNPWAVGCYTSMIRVKQAHRRLENDLFSAEKMAAAAAFQSLMPYPAAELAAAQDDLLTAQFHDALPGSSIQPVEEHVLRALGRGIETAGRVKMRAFFALAGGQARPRAGAMPIFVYNHHPWPVRALVACELQGEEPNRGGTFLWPRLTRGGRSVPAQVEKEESNINEDHRKRVVFEAHLDAACMNRFDCVFEHLPARPPIRLRERGGRFRHKTRDLDVIVNARTGLIDRCRVRGADVLAPRAFRPLVMADNADPWGMTVKSFRRRAGAFRLMSAAAAGRFSGFSRTALPAVRVIEDGPVRSVVEALFAYGGSFICQQYKLPKSGTEIEIAVRVFWNEKDRMLKLSIPTAMPGAEYIGQVACGRETLKTDGDEVVSQKWTAVVSRERGMALTCINAGTYGSDMAKGEMRISLLRSPAYAGHPVGGAPIIVEDRFVPRIDQGERAFRFWINAGPVKARLDRIDGEALARNEAPFALAFSPPGGGRKPRPGVRASDPAVVVQAVKKSERGRDLIVRLFETTGRPRTVRIEAPFIPARSQATLGGFELKSLAVSPRTGRFREVDLLERPVRRNTRP